MIDGVKQHKWWGWGEEGRSYHHDDKPKFAPFVKKLVGVDINEPVTPMPQLSDLEVPASRLEPELRDSLIGISGAEYVQSDDETRVVHGLGKGVRDLMRVRAGDEVRVVSSPGHRVTCTRWFAHHDPRDAQAMLNSEIFGNCVIAPFTRAYVRAAAHERVG